MKNLLHTISIVTFLLIFYSVTAQMSIQSQNTIGGQAYDEPKSMLTLKDGSILVYGNSSSGISGDKTLGLYGYIDIWMLKLNSSFGIVWQKSFGGDSTQIPTEIIASKDGGYLMLSYSNSSISGVKTVPNYGNSDLWLIKLDSNFSLQWQKSFGGSSAEYGINIIELENGNILIGSQSYSGPDGIKTTPNYGYSDYWVLMLDSTGSKIWEKNFGGNSFDALICLKKLNDNKFILAGSSFSPISGNKEVFSEGMGDIWMLCIDSLGNKIWEKNYGGDDEESSLDIVVINPNEFYLAVTSSSGISGDKTCASYGYNDCWLLKLDSNGNKIWDKAYGGLSYEWVTNMSLNHKGHLLISLNTYSGIGGIKNEVNRGIGYTDYWILEIDTAGVFVDQKTLGGTKDDSPYFCIETSNNEYIVGGSSKSGIGGDKTGVNKGLSDFWLLKLASHVGIDDKNFYTNNFCKLYPNPTSDIVHFASAENQQIH